MQPTSRLRGVRFSYAVFDLMSEFTQLVAAEIPSLRRYSRALVRKSADVADDLVQSCLVRAIEKQHLFGVGTNIRAWLFRILHNEYVNYVRRSVWQGGWTQITEDIDIGIKSNAMANLELRDLRIAISMLPMEHYVTLLLIGLEGMSYDDAANILNVPVGTVRSRLSRARDGLRILMGIVDCDEIYSQILQ